MNARSLLALLGAFVVLAVLAVVGQRGNDGSGGNGERGAEFAPGVQAALTDVERVTLTKAAGETIATLERRPDGWVVVEKGGYRADVAKLRQALTALAEARVLEQKTANPDAHSRLGVEDVASDTAAGIALALTAPGLELPTVILGNAEGSKYRYARRADDAQSYLIDRDPDLPRSAAQWVDTDVIDVRPDRVQQVTITHPDGEVVTISKTQRAAANFTVEGVPEGRELLYPGVANVIGNSLRELNLEDVAPAEAAGEESAADVVTVEFRTFDGLIVSLRGSEKDDEAWITLAASFSAEQAAQFAESADADAAPVDPVASATEEPQADETADVAAEADRINRNVSGWRYRIAGYQYDQLTRRIADLLQAPPA